MAEKEAKKEGRDSREQALYTGVWILIMLAVLTFGEFIVGVIAPPWGIVLIIVAAFKAYWVLVEYMHIGRLFSSEEETHE